MPVTPRKLQELQNRMATLGVCEAELEESFTRGSGKGGQKVNKTNNCVCLRHLPSGVVVRCHREREREVNRYLARRALCDELEHLLQGAPSARQREAVRHPGRSPRSLTITRRKDSL